jgi:hypothetical protein
MHYWLNAGEYVFAEPLASAGLPEIRRMQIAEKMAQTVSVVITDDLDGSPAAEAMTFSFNGQGYEINLAPANQARMREALLPFIEAGRRVGQRKPARSARPRQDLSAVRAWASAQGLQVADRGRISAEIMSKYEAATQG